MVILIQSQDREVLTTVSDIRIDHDGSFGSPAEMSIRVTSNTGNGYCVGRYSIERAKTIFTEIKKHIVELEKRKFWGPSFYTFLSQIYVMPED